MYYTLGFIMVKQCQTYIMTYFTLKLAPKPRYCQNSCGSNKCFVI